MARYSVTIKPSAVRDVERIPRKRDRQRIVERIGRLADDPRPPGSIKLTGHDLYRVRQGSYRILYAIEDAVAIVLVVAVGDRREIYRRLR